MNNRHFNASQWLKNRHAHGSDSALHTNSAINNSALNLPPLPEIQATPSGQPGLGHFFTPDWRGDGLLSRHAISVKNCIQFLWENAISQIGRQNHFNKTLKQSAFLQFTSLCQKLSRTPENISNPEILWKELLSPKSQHADLLDLFKEIYAFRAVTVYLYKLKFIAHLADDLPFHVSDDYLLNPNSYLTGVFKKGSSSELFCSALWPNAFSWYRPDALVKDKLNTLAVALKQLSTPEMMKVCTYTQHRKSVLPDAEQEFSHSFSHRALGMWLNQLLIHFPKWIEKGSSAPNLFSSRDYPEVLNTLLWGSHVPSLCQSHWLAQESSLSPDWTQILCPDFLDENIGDGPYFKICHELQYLTFLLKVANKLNKEVVPFLCCIMRQKYLTHRDSQNGQLSMFQGQAGPELVYQRIILNLSDMPKHNPHFYLVSKLDQFAAQMAANGVMYIFTSQKLFVPSQNEKTRQLMNSYRLEASISFEDLKGKGEIPAHLYILTKRQRQKKDVPTGSRPIKESCLCFRLQGELTQFNKFAKIGQEFTRFLTEKSSSTVAYHVECGEGLTLQFHQDAILDGVLLQSSKEGNITHPNFFKNLTTKCLPLDHFFQMESIDPIQDSGYSQFDDLFAMDLLRPKIFPYVLMVNISDPEQVQLKVISGGALKAHVEQYGCAYYLYFGLIPKKHDLNINIFREYFQSSIGHQIIQLSLHGGATKIKGKLKSLLIPASFSFAEVPAQTFQSMDVLSLEPSQYLLESPENLSARFESAKIEVLQHAGQHSWYVLGMLAHFRSSLSDAIYRVQGKSANDQNIIFENPMITKELVALNARPIYPHSDDLYLEFVGDQKQNIHKPLSLAIFKLHKEETCLILESSDSEVVRMHGDKILLDFIAFILLNAISIPISKILSSLKVPATKELKAVMAKHEVLEQKLSTLSSEARELINRIFTDLISKQ